MADFQRLDVWKRAHRLTAAVYRATSRWPREEIYGLTAQTRRAAVSIGGNISEGCGRGLVTELAQYTRIARGSASELQNYFLLAGTLGFWSRQRRNAFLTELTVIQRMLNGLLRWTRDRRARDETSGKRAHRRPSTDDGG